MTASDHSVHAGSTAAPTRGRGGHVPERTCVGCKTLRRKRDLVRLVVVTAADAAGGDLDAGRPADEAAGTGRHIGDANPPQEGVMVDPTGRREGRGAYLCRDHPSACLALAERRRALPRALRITPDRVDGPALRAAVATLPQEEQPSHR